MLLALLLAAVAATVFALSAGLWNFWCGGDGERANFWMRSRLIFQGLAITLFAAALWKGYENV